jgi:hypothetical protein
MVPALGYCCCKGFTFNGTSAFRRFYVRELVVAPLARDDVIVASGGMSHVSMACVTSVSQQLSVGHRCLVSE